MIRIDQRSTDKALRLKGSLATTLGFNTLELNLMKFYSLSYFLINYIIT